VTDASLTDQAAAALDTAADKVADASAPVVDSAAKAAESAKTETAKAADAAKAETAKAAENVEAGAEKAADTAKAETAKAAGSVKAGTAKAVDTTKAQTGKAVDAAKDAVDGATDDSPPVPRTMDEIEAELDATRERLAGRIDDLQEYVSPRNVAQRQLDKVKGVFVDEYGGIKPDRVLVAVGAVVAVVGLGVLLRRRRR